MHSVQYTYFKQNPSYNTLLYRISLASSKKRPSLALSTTNYLVYYTTLPWPQESITSFSNEQLTASFRHAIFGSSTLVKQMDVAGLLEF